MNPIITLLAAAMLALAGCAAPGGQGTVGGTGFGALERDARGDRGVHRDARDLQRAPWDRADTYNNDQSR